MSRYVDRDNGVRTKPMKVIGVGLCRTGTMGLYWALQILGYRPYHMLELLEKGGRDMTLMAEATEAKVCGTYKPYGREEFDKWFGEYDAVCDAPSALFVDEIYEAYPDAKFILTDRDVDSWIKSMNKTIFRTMDSWTIPVLSWLDWKMHRPFYRMGKVITQKWCDSKDEESVRRKYLDHVEHVKRVIPPEKLLYLKLEDGITWDKICAFLDKPIPDQPYPKGNDPNHFRKVSSTATKKAIVAAAGRWLMYWVPVIAAGAWYVRNQPGGLRRLLSK